MMCNNLVSTVEQKKNKMKPHWCIPIIYSMPHKAWSGYQYSNVYKYAS